MINYEKNKLKKEKKNILITNFYLDKKKKKWTKHLKTNFKKIINNKSVLNFVKKKEKKKKVKYAFIIDLFLTFNFVFFYEYKNLF